MTPKIVFKILIFSSLVVLVRLSFPVDVHINATTQLCCQKLYNSTELRCWNESSEENKPYGSNTSKAFACEKNTKWCFDVTSAQNCYNNSVSGAEEQDKPELHIGAFVPFKQVDRYGYYTAMKMAIDIINNRTDILADYKLVLDAEDTASATGLHAIKAFFSLLNKTPRPIILLGPSNTASLEPVAEGAPNWNLIQVSYASGSPKFESKLTYPLTFRALPSSSSYSKAKAAFIQHYGWKRVAIIHEYDPEFFSPTVDKLKIELTKRNISVIAMEGFEKLGDASFQMNKLKKLDARIIIGEFSYIGARKIFCEAFSKKMYGPNYAWIIFGQLSPRQIFSRDEKLKRFINCTSDQLKQAAERYIATVKLDIRQDNQTTISSLTARSYTKELQALNEGSVRTDSAYAFDAAWAIALTLNKSVTAGIKYNALQHRNSSVILALRNWMQQINFQGLTGPVRFEENKERMGTVLLKQNREGMETRIGQHFTFADQLHIFDSEVDKIWEDNRPPKDHTIRKYELLMSPLPLIVIMWLMAALGIVCSLCFLYFNVSNGNNRIIKMSSPKLNNIIILGCILCYASVVLFGLDGRFLGLEQYGIICNARTTVLSIGFSLSFGAMFSKTWRVHKIFTAAKTLKKMAIKDVHLLVIVVGLLAVDVVFLSSWIAVDPFKAEQLNFEEEFRKEQDTIIIPALYHCNCKYKTYFLAALFAYKGILLLFGLFLAWETRDVSIPALNDSKYIGMSVYNVVILSIIGAIVAIALDGSMYNEAPYAISSLCLILCTTVTLLLVFVPKIYQFLLKDELTNQTSTMHAAQTRSRAHSNSSGFTCGSPLVKERQTSFTCKATQTERDLPGSAVNAAMFKFRGSRSDDLPYDIQMDDILLDESLVLSVTPTRPQTWNRNGNITTCLEST